MTTPTPSQLRAARRLLGLPTEGPLEEQTIIKTYRRLAYQHHPDHGGDPLKMGEMSEAYDLLREHPRHPPTYQSLWSTDTADVADVMRDFDDLLRNIRVKAEPFQDLMDQLSDFQPPGARHVHTTPEEDTGAAMLVQYSDRVVLAKLPANAMVEMFPDGRIAVTDLTSGRAHPINIIDQRPTPGPGEPPANVVSDPTWAG